MSTRDTTDKEQVTEYLPKAKLLNFQMKIKRENSPSWVLAIHEKFKLDHNKFASYFCKKPYNINLQRP